MVANGRSILAGVAVVLAIAGAACGGGGSSNTSGVVSCTAVESVGDVGMLQVCTELPASQRQQAQQSCMLPAGAFPADAGFSATAKFADGPCSHVNALGGCRVTNGPITETGWYYAPTVPDADPLPTGGSPDIQALCATIGATYVAP